MKGKFGDTLNELEKSIEDLRSHGISIKALEKSFADLKKQSSNIEKVEDNIEAIREEVIDRIKDELDENKRAGKFSMFGFWIGAIALVLSIFSSISTLKNEPTVFENITDNQTTKFDTLKSQQKTISQKIDLINKRVEKLTYNLVGFDNDYEPNGYEYVINSGYSIKPKTILETDDKHTLKIKISDITEIEKNDTIIPQVGLELYVDDMKLGLEGIKRFVQMNSENTVLYDEYSGAFTANELDTIKLLSHHYLLKRVYRKKSKILVIGDEKDGILLEYIKKKDTLPNNVYKK